MKKIDPYIICCYLYPITKYGYPPPAENTITYLEEMKALGFQSVELEGIRETHLLQMREMRFDIKKKLTELDLQVPVYCAVLPGLASHDQRERTQNLQLFELGCETARELGAHAILDNGPLPPYQFPEGIPVARHYDEDTLRVASLPAALKWRPYWANLVATYRQACDIAASYGLTYHLHPCLGALVATADAFLYFQDAVGRGNLRFNLDTANQFFLRDNLVLCLRRLAGSIDYIHLSDNRGVRVEHLPPGQGIVNWDDFFAALKLIAFKGEIGIDIGGAESAVADLDSAYVDAASWLETKWKRESK
ncbi:MAG TPA: sugar phosphate isomerase/epimerase family protein [bacterium]